MIAIAVALAPPKMRRAAKRWMIWRHTRHAVFNLAGLAAFVFLALALLRHSPPIREEALLSRYHMAVQFCREGREETRDHWCRKADQKLGELRQRGYYPI